MQYIGARYVPKFMGTFDPTQIYENMCVVENGLGTSYISKIPVPAGTSLTDTTYWAIYGASSGAIINLQNQIGDLTDLTTSDQNSLVDAINEVDADIQTLTDEVHNGDVIIIGNSYVYNGVANELKTHYVHNFVELAGSGAGFVAYSGQGNTYANALTTCINGLTDEQKADIRAVVFVSAMGDSRAQQEVGTYATLLSTAIATIENTVANDLPNCKMVAVTLAESRNVASFANNGWTNLFKLHRTFKQTFGNSKIKYVGWSGFNVLFNASMFESDNYHPSAAGCARIGHDIVKQIFGGFEYLTLSSDDTVNVDDYSTGTQMATHEAITPDFASLSLRMFVPANVTPTFAYNSVLLDSSNLRYPLPAFSEIDAYTFIKRGNDTIFEGVIVWKGNTDGVMVGTVADVTSVPSTAPTSTNKFICPCEITIM